MNGLRLMGAGYALPKTALDNEAMTQYVETSDEWITSRTGIRQRYFCGDGESTTTLAIEAAGKALADSGIAKEEIGCVIVATSSGEYAMPSTACLVHKALALNEGIPVFDLGAACAGFLYALDTARAMLLAHGGKYALVVGAEQMSHVLDMADRNTCVLFGDAAGAVVLRSSSENALWQVADVSCASDGSLRELIQIGGGTAAHIKVGDSIGPDWFVSMQGMAVFKHAVRNMAEESLGLLERSGMSFEDVDLFIPHQANLRIIKAVGERLGLGEDKVFANVQHYGNTSAATLPVAMADARASGRLAPGMKVLLTSFGSGMTWGSALLV